MAQSRYCVVNMSPETGSWCNSRNTFHEYHACNPWHVWRNIKTGDAQRQRSPQSGLATQRRRFVAERLLVAQVYHTSYLLTATATNDGSDAREASRAIKRKRGRGGERERNTTESEKKRKIQNDNPQGAALLLEATDAMEMSDKHRRGSAMDRYYCCFPLALFVAPAPCEQLCRLISTHSL